MDVLVVGAMGTSILGAVGRASLQGALVVAAVWIVCRLFRRLPASLRCGLWWLACAKLVFGLGWSLVGAEPVRLAVLPAAVHSVPAPVVLARHPEGESRAGRIWASGPFLLLNLLPDSQSLRVRRISVSQVD